MKRLLNYSKQHSQQNEMVRTKMPKHFLVATFFALLFIAQPTNAQVNNVPTDIKLSSTAVARNAMANRRVGLLSAIDMDADGTYTYTLVGGDGDDDNDAFRIDGVNLIIRATPATGKSSYSIRIQVNDGTNDFVKEFTITVSDDASFIDDFFTAWRTTGANESITIPTTGSGYSYTVDWGDGGMDTATYTGNATHTYADAGDYTVRIKGAFPRIYFNDGGDKGKIIAINQWGTGQWTSMEGAFSGATHLVGEATDSPDLSQVTNMWGMFRHAENFNQDIGDWDVSNVTNMTYMFANATDFNQDIGGWDVSSVTNMGSMFDNTPAFGQNLGAWYITGDLSVPPTLGAGGAVTTFTAQNTVLSGQNPDYTLATGGDVGLFTLTDGVLSINDAPASAKTSYNIRIEATGSFGEDNHRDLTLVANHSPEITSNSGVSPYEILLPENTQDVTTITATDMDANATLSYTLSDDDVVLFEITNSGALSFKDAYIPVYETPRDSRGNIDQNADQEYRVLVAVSDGISTDTQEIRVTITPVNEPPTGIKLSSTAVARNAMANRRVGLLSAIDMDADGTYTYTLVGGDGDDDNDAFRIDGSSLRIKATPATGKSSYSIRIQVNDGTNDFVKEFTITVSDDASFIDDFFTAWRTTGANESITIPTTGSGYSYTVDWGDGGMDTATYTGNATHTYADAGDYTVRIKGAFPRIYFNDGGDKGKIIAINQWGTGQWTSMEGAFSGATHLVGEATDSPDLSQVTNMWGMFRHAENFNQDIGDWDVSNVTNMTYMFANATDFNQDIGGWDVSSVTDMGNMFNNTPAFGQNLGAWYITGDFSVPPTLGAGGAVTTFTAQNIVLSGQNPDYTLATGGDAGLFTLTDGVLSINDAPASAKTSYNIRIEATGSFGEDNHRDLTLVANHSPEITSNSGVSPYEIPLPENTKAVTTITATDADMNTLSYTLSDDDAALFEITGTGNSRALSFKYAYIPVYETPRDSRGNVDQNADQEYRVLVTVSDGISTDTQEIRVTITPVNEPPTGIKLSSITVARNAMANRRVGLLSAIDMDADGTYTYTLVGGDGDDDNDAFRIDGSNLIIRATPTADKQGYDIRINVSDGINDFVKEFTITVSDDASFIDDFFTAWRTTGANESITIPTTGSGYSYTVDWGDGGMDTATYTGNATHTYADAGDYTVRIKGAFPRIYFNDGGDKGKIIAINQWGTGQWTSMEGAFSGATHLVGEATDSPDLSQVTNMWGMFRHAENFNQDIGDWDVSNVTNMTYMFANATDFNQDIGGWDVSSVTDMSNMFNNTPAFGQNLGAWYITGDFSVPPTLGAGGAVTTFTAQNTVLSGQNPDYTLATGGDAGLFTLTDGVLSINDAPASAKTSYNIRIEATGSFGEDNHRDLTLVANHSPEITSNSGVSPYEILLPENTQDVTTITATDMDANATLSYTLSDDDVVLFEITNSGALSFKDAYIPVYETPRDSRGNIDQNADQEYRVLVAVSDGISADTQEIRVTITPVNEPPTGIKLSSTAVARNAMANRRVGLLSAIDMDADGTYTYTLVGGDGDDDNDAFRIDGSNLIILATPATGKSSYSIRIQVNDGTNDFVKEFTITVSDDASFIDDFFTAWRTTGANESITIPTTGSGYSYTVDWGDGGMDTATYTGNATHTYADAGDYTVRIKGAFPRIYFNDGGDKGKIIAINQWGTGQWTSMEGAFSGATHLVGEATDSPDLSQVTNMWGMFRHAENFNQDIGDWDVSNVTNMTYMFANATDFNQDIGGWDVSSVTDMSNMFNNTPAFGQNLGAWYITGDLSVPPTLGAGGAVTTFTAQNTVLSGQNPDYTLATGGDAGLFTLNNGVLSINDAPASAKTSYNIRIEATGSFGEDNHRDLTLVANHSPEITSNSGVSPYEILLPENTQDVTTITATDMDANATLSYTLSDDDAALFEITGTGNSRALSFKDAYIPVYETPRDSRGNIDQNADQEYRVLVTVSDGISTDTQEIRVTITPVNEPPTGIKLSSTAVARNAMANRRVGLLSATDIDTDDTHTYTLIDGNGDTDNALFTIDGTSLRIRATPATGKSSYSIRINVNDGTNDFADDFDITVSTTPLLTDDFVTTWSVIAGQTITIPTSRSGGYNYTVNWGSGQAEDMTVYEDDANGRADATHTYATTGTYTVRISGSFPHIYFYSFPSADFTRRVNAESLTAITQWGTGQWTAMSDAFQGCLNLAGQAASDAPDLSRVTNMRAMFRGASAFNHDIGDWDVSNVTEMQQVFQGASVFNQDIGDWDVSAVINMFNTFNGATVFDQDIGDWNVSSVVDVTGMFNGADAFSQNLGLWYITAPDLAIPSTLGAGGAVTTFTAQNAILSGQNPTYTLATGGDAGLFTLNNGVLSINDAPTSAKTSYNIRIEATGSFGTDNHRDLTLVANHRPEITDPGEIPLPENTQAVTTITATDTDANTTLNYTLSNDDVALFEITDTGVLSFKAEYIPDYENPRDALGNIDQNADQEYSVLVTVSDGISTDTQEIRVTITPVNETAPTNIKLSSTTVARTAMANRRVGLLSAIDMDADGTYRYTLVAGNGDDDNDAFTIDGSNLIIVSTPTASKSSYNIRIKVNDGTNDFAKEFTITVSDDASLMDDFFTTWRVTAGQEITIPTTGSGYSYTVDWGDGGMDTDTHTGNATHTYADAGDYTVRISGSFPRIYFNAGNGNDNSNSIIAINQWGAGQWTSMEGAFSGATNLVGEATDSPDLSQVTNMWGMFRHAENFNQDIGDWDVSNVESMGITFEYAENFNQDIGDWDVSNVTNMTYMFAHATDFNQDIGDWDVSSVTDMSNMFNNTPAFGQNLGAWYITGDLSVSPTLGAGGAVTTFTAQNTVLSGQNPDYTLATGGDAGLFTLTDGVLSINDAPTSAKTSYNIRIEATGSFGEDNHRDLTLVANHSPEITSNSGVSPYEIPLPENTQDVTTITVTDMDANATLSYTLSDDDVALFEITGTGNSRALSFKDAYIPDYENPRDSRGNIDQNADQEYRVLVTVSDGISIDTQEIRVTITPVNEPPTGIKLSSTTVARNAMANRRVGLLFATDIDTDDTHIYTLVAGNGDDDNDAFRIDDTNLIIVSTPATGKSSYNIRINVNDGTNDFAKAFTITVSDDASLIDDFFTTWRVTAGQAITIPTTGSGYSYTVDWGDGGMDTDTYTGNATHTYADAGDYTVRINGSFPRIYFNAGNGNANSNSIIVINQWGTGQWTSMEGAFSGATNLIGEATDSPDLSQVTNMWGMFRHAENFNQDIGDWDVSNVESMGTAFEYAYKFNQDIGDWDVSNVTNMTYMFANGTTNGTVFNQDISGWDVSSVTNMTSMFDNATAFSQNLGRWYITAPDLAIPPTLGAGGAVTTFTAQNTVLSGQNPDYTLATGGDAGLFTLNNGVLSINDAPASAKTSYNIRIEATGSFGTDNHRDLTFVANHRPEITSNSGVSPYEIPLPENTKAVTTITATDADMNTLSYTLSDDDVALFEITDSGALNFKDAYIPDYENPRDSRGNIDSNADQEYRVLVTVSDGISIDTQEIRVTITPVNATAPTNIKLSSTTVARNAMANRRVGLLSAIDMDADGTYTYTLVAGNGDDDNDAFRIDGVNLIIRATPATGKSSYNIRIKVNDGIHDYSKTFAISVSDDASLMDDFFTTWRVTAGQAITIPTTGSGYSYTVDWGDGGMDTDTHTGNATHTYADAGDYTVRINGSFPRIYFNAGNGNDNSNSIIAINQWGTGQWTSMEGACSGATNLVGEATDSPDLSQVTNMWGMFRHAENFNQDIGDWDVSNVESMGTTFEYAYKFNQDIGDWDVSNVTNMTYMFANGTTNGTAFNQDISGWDVSSVTNMTSMFDNATAFSQNLGRWYITGDFSVPPTLGAGGAVTTFTAQNTVLSGQNPTYTLATGGDAGLFTLNNGVLSINDAPTSEKTSYNIRIEATGSFGEDNHRDLTLVANHRPEITDPGEIPLPENTQDVITITATDMDANATLSYTLSDDDVALFEITDSGALSFKDAYIPDYENPRDSRGNIDQNADQEYRVLVTVSDGISTDTQEISVTITPVNDTAPTNIKLSSTTVARTAMANRRVGLLSAIDMDDADGTYTYTLVAGNGDTANDAFRIDGNNLIIRATPTASKSSYNIRIKVSDGIHDYSKTFAITVSDDASLMDDFFTTWRVTANQAITIPTTGSGYSYTVDWGDGGMDTDTHTGNATHTYADAGDYTVRIKGAFPRIYFNDGGDKGKIIAINQWGTGQWTSMEGAFSGAANLVGEATDSPDLSQVTNMWGMFRHAENFNQDIGDWDVSNVESMGTTFEYAENFNQDIGDWNVSNVTNMTYMFAHATDFNQDIGDWDVSSVTNMSNMFLNANAFEKNLGRWYITGNFSVPPTLGAGGAVTTFTAQNTVLSGQNPTYTLATGGDAGLFTLINGVLSINDAPTSAKTSYNIRIEATGSFGTDNHRDLTLVANHSPEITSNSGVSSYAITLPENTQAVTTITATDADMNTLSYTLSNDDAALFEITGTGNSRALSFKDAYIPDYENPRDSRGNIDSNADQEYSVLVTVSDGISIDTQEISVTITPVNETAPTNIKLSSTTVARNIMANRRVGLLSAIDMDADGTYRYTLVAGNGDDDNDAFRIDGVNLIIRATPATGKSSYNIRINVNDGTNDFAKAFTITVSDDASLIDDFFTTWRVTAGQAITIPTTGSGYSYTVDWGDGGMDTDTHTGNATHTYADAGDYTVRISGSFPRIYFNAGNGNDNSNSIIAINQWGTGQWTSMIHAFEGATNLVGVATDSPDLSQVTNMWGMFRHAENFNQDIGDWDVSNVESMGTTFEYADKFNQDIGDWDVSNVTTMAYMLANATDFNQDIGDWDVSSVTDMDNMFNNTSDFSQNLGTWYITAPDLAIPPTLGAGGAVTTFTAQNTVLSGQNPTYTLATGGDAGLFTLTDGVLSINDAPASAKTSYNIRIEATGSFGTDNHRDLTFVVNNRPEITSQSGVSSYAITLPENTQAVTTITATDADMNTLSYTLSDDDVALFEITNSGALSFKDAYIPDYENPRDSRGNIDSNADQEYSVLVAVSDGISTDTQEIRVTITPVNEPPTGIKLSSTAVARNAMANRRVGLLSAIDMDADGTYTYTYTLVGGDGDDDNDAFRIEGVNLIIRATPVAGKSSYNIRIQVNDGTNDFVKEFAITVSDDASFIDDFFTAWRTTGANESITIPTTGSGYSYTVDWGDGGMDTDTYTGNATHTYADAGDYTVRISGSFPRIYFNADDGNTNSNSIIAINQWGTGQWTSMEGAFSGATNLVGVATDSPDLSQVTNMWGMFRHAENFNQDIGDWDVSNVESMGTAFEYAENFNQDIGDWNVSNVTNMTFMFANATDFNQGIGGWDVSSVTDMSNMFNNTPAFSQNLGVWYITAPDLAIPPTLGAGGAVTTFTAQNTVLSGQNPTYTLATGGDAGLFTLTDGVLSINDAPTSAKTSYDISIEATGSSLFGTDNQRDLTFVVNNRPEITSQSGVSSYAITLPENTQAVTTITATDMDENATLSYTLSNDDAALFEITNSGVLSFKDAYIPDYENPRDSRGNIDSNADQEYRVLVTVSDGISIDTQEISVTITPVNETAPTNIKLSSTAVARNAMANRRVGLLSAIDMDADGTYTYTLVDGDGGTDNGAFTIDGTNLIIRATPTADKSSYNIRINVNDGIHDFVKKFTITVSDDASLMDDFFTTWRVTAGQAITIPTTGSGYSYTVDWGDGGMDTATYTGNATHTYADAGDYTVRINGSFPRIYFNAGNGNDNSNSIIAITQWGTGQWTSMEGAFSGATNLIGEATDSPDLSQVTNMWGMFRHAENFNQDIGDWDVSNVESMGTMFEYAYKFNQDIGDWDVSNVTTMAYMFAHATDFNQGIGGWDVSSVTDMDNMFNNTPVFSQTLGAWYITGDLSILPTLGAGGAVTTFTAQNTVLSGQNPVYSLSSGADADSFTLTGAGALTINVAPTMANTSYNIRISSTGSFGEDNHRDLTLIVNHNSPEITSHNGVSPYEITLPENTKAVTTITATDADMNTLSYTLSDDDVALFEITDSGALSFKDAYIPDYDNPRNSLGEIDPNADQEYRVLVTVSDGIFTATQKTATQEIIVTIIALAAPSITLSTNTLIATVGTAIETITIDATAGGMVASYSIDPVLPSGLSFDTATGTGTISGTPTVVADLATYTITATNAIGSAMATVAITVNASPSPTATADVKSIDVSVSPNPIKAGDRITITVASDGVYRLFGISGEFLTKGTLTKGDNAVAFPSLAKGMYLLKIHTIHGRVTRKVVKN